MCKVVNLAAIELKEKDDRVFLDSRSAKYTSEEIDAVLCQWQLAARAAGFRVIIDYDSLCVIDHDNERIVKTGGETKFYLVANSFNLEKR